MSDRRYCLVTPCRDEARTAERTLRSVLAQSEPPALWVLVDDGSSDDTPGILAAYAAVNPNLRVVRRPDRGARQVGGGVIDAFYAGYETVAPLAFPYLCKLDLDLELPPTYFARLLDRLEADPRLGTCSGKPYFHRSGGLPPPEAVRFPLGGEDWISEKIGDEVSTGASKFYRSQCLREIGGFVRGVMWDGIDVHRCRQLGWKAASWDEPQLRFAHLRPMGSSQTSWLTGRMRHGAGQYFMGTSPLYMFASGLYRMSRPPLLAGGAAMIWGYLHGALQQQPRYGDAQFRRFLRRYQRACLLQGKRRATEALEAQGAAWWTQRG